MPKEKSSKKRKSSEYGKLLSNIRKIIDDFNRQDHEIYKNSGLRFSPICNRHESCRRPFEEYRQKQGSLALGALRKIKEICSF